VGLDNKLIVGLTGSFGSGCGTIQKVLEHHYGFKPFKLSKEVRLEAERRGVGDSRPVLQNVGTQLREKKGNNYLAIKTIEEASKTSYDQYVFRGFRHPDEIAEFRKFPTFFLVAVDCSKESRWIRLGEKLYKGNRLDFERDDAVDKNEGLPYGQQVLRCVEEADIIFINEESYLTPIKIEAELKKRFEQYVRLMTGEGVSQPNPHETMMSIASILALQSRCIKRRVGAVLCKEGVVVCAAYNEIPEQGRSCLEEYGMCYRDYYRQEQNEKAVRKFSNCPVCGINLEANSLTPPNFSCPHCEDKLVKILPHYKALDKCRSVHAEEAVILRTPEFLINNSTLYCTTFPCLQCAKRVIYSGIKKVIYVDPYPEEESMKTLEKAGVKAEKFQGVKAQVFYRLFHAQREILERQIKEKMLKEYAQEKKEVN